MRIIILLFSLHIIGHGFATGQVKGKHASDFQGLRSGNIFEYRYKLPKGSVINHAEYHVPIQLKEAIRFSIVDEVGDSTFIIMQENPEEIIPRRLNTGPLHSVSLGNVVTLHYFLKGPKKFFRFRYRGISFKPLTIPFKMRPGRGPRPTQLISDVSIGPYLGYEIGTQSYAGQRVKNSSVTISMFATPSFIRLDPSTSEGQEINTIIAFSTGGGILFSLNHFQTGIVTGFDFTGGDASRDWIYQWKQWVSFAIGYNMR